ncbi:MAG TPA: hypothetical protein VKC62_12010 [Gaiellaceae bacterium]|nr:hypothetical protein [Gaiellaceae bacterium]
MIASIGTLLIPLWILLGLLVLMGVLALLGRIQGGRYLRPLIQLIAKVPLFRRWLEKASNAALERSNPELASAMKKMQRHAKHLHDPQRAQAAMSQLTRQERAALLEMQDQQGVEAPATNRQMRRRLEKQRRDAQRRGR